jgi:hypothetical protein
LCVNHGIARALLNDHGASFGAMVAGRTPWLFAEVDNVLFAVLELFEHNPVGISS